MNNLGLSLKKFFTNKNTVTIIGVVAILVILYFMYTKQIKKATKEVEIPVANKQIDPETQISYQNDVRTIKIAQAAKPEGVLTSKAEIDGKYTGIGVTIPVGGMFYKDLIVNKEDLPGNWITLVGADERPYYFSVNVTTTFGNSIQPGDLVDFYMRAYDEDNKLIFGRIFNDQKVLAVTDSAGKNVFRSQNSIGTPSFLNFGFDLETYQVMKYAEYANGSNIEIIVVPRGGNYDADEILNSGDSKKISATEARNFIKSHGSEEYKNVYDDGNMLEDQDISSDNQENN